MKRGVALFGAVGLACVVVGANSADLFVWEQANTLAATASTQQEYVKVANIYNRLVLGGINNGTLFMNLGAVLVMAGDGINAEAAFKRAERYLGATPETRQGLKAALMLREGRASVDLPWSRTAFFWHYAFPCKVRAVTALGGWVLLWSGVLFHILARGRKERAMVRSLAETCMVTGALLALFFTASTLLTMTHERHDVATWSARHFMAAESGSGGEHD